MRAATLLAVLLALSGATAGPARVTESTRLLASIVRVCADQEPAQVSLQAAPIAIATPVEPPRVSTTAPLRSRDLPDQLYQRPPPSRS
jgi:hypothetical protein